MSTHSPRLHSAPPVTGRKLRFALVGCGRIAANHMAALEKHADRAELVAVCDPDPAALAAAVARTGAQGFAQLHEMLANVTTVSGTARDFLATNENNLIHLADINDGLLQTAARYSTEYPCLLGGLENLGKREADAFRNYTLHIVLEVLPQQPRRYTPADRPHFGEDRGPACGHLPSPPWSQKNPVTVQPSMNDGVSGPVRRAPLGEQFFRNGFGYAGSPAESEVYDELLAPGLGVAASDVPDLGGLLVGPMARGATVGLTPAEGSTR